MAEERPVLNAHGAKRLPSVEVDSYNLEIKDEDGFVGDKASRGAFHDILEKWREPLRKLGVDPLGEKLSEDMSKKQLDKMLAEGDPEAGGIIHSAVEEFAQTLTSVIKRFLKTSAWRDTEAIVIGGGFRDSRVGELAVGRTEVLLKSGDHKIEIELIRNHPDEAGLIGTAHLMPSWMLQGFDGILAVDIGGTNIRAGIVETKLKKAKDLSKAGVFASDLWRHGDEKTKRDEAVSRLNDMLLERHRAGREEGAEARPRGRHRLPWAHSRGRLDRDGRPEPAGQLGEQPLQPRRTASARRIPLIDEHETQVVIHNDAVVQGLSELPVMQDYERWGVLTIGTGSRQRPLHQPAQGVGINFLPAR